MYVYTWTMYLLIRVKSLMGLKFWRSWGVDKKISKLQQVRLLLKNHTKFRDLRSRIPFRCEPAKQNKQANQTKQAKQIKQANIYKWGTNMCTSKVLWVLKSGEVGALTNQFKIYSRNVWFWKIMLNFLFLAGERYFLYKFRGSFN